MPNRVAHAVSGVARPTLTIIAIMVLGGGLGVLVALSGAADALVVAPLAALAVLALCLAVVAPDLLIALALPGSLLMARVGGFVSISDVVLAAATVISLVLVRGAQLLPIQALLWAGVAYLAAALPTVVLNPFAANAVEWLHEVVLVLGSMVVGFAVARLGRARFAVGLYVVGCLVIAVAATVVGALMFLGGEGFGPVYLPDLHKNLIGGALAVAVVLLYARPVWFRWRPAVSWWAIAVLAVGIAASGSRQGMIGAVAGLLVVALRPHPETGRLRLVPWVFAVPVSIVVMTRLTDQLDTGDAFNSAYQRLDWYAQTLDTWQLSPVFGVGLRWWYTGHYGAFQPPNAELEVLSSTGVVGLVGFLTMFAVAAVALWRLDPRYGTAALAVVATRFTQAQFDLYWVAGQASLLWIVAGLAYGAWARDQDAAPAADAVSSPAAAAALRSG